MRLALLVLGLAAALARVEPATKIDFPDSRKGQALVGVGVRKKGPIKVRVLGRLRSSGEWVKRPQQIVADVVRSCARCMV